MQSRADRRPSGLAMLREGRPRRRSSARRGSRTLRLAAALIVVSLLATSAPGLAETGELRLEEARSLAAARDYAGAVDLFDSVLEEDPDNLDALSGKAHVQAWMGDYDSARETFGRALEFAPGHLESLTGIADLLAWEGRPEASVSVLESLPPRLAGEREVLIRLARYQFWAGRKDEARAYAERILALDPGDPEAREILDGAGLRIRAREFVTGQRISRFGEQLYGYQFYASLWLESGAGSRMSVRYDRYRRYGDNVDRFQLGGAGRLSERWRLSGNFAMAPGADFLPISSCRAELAYVAGRGLVLYGDARLAGYRNAFLSGYSLAAEYYAGRHLVLTARPTLIATRFHSGQVAHDAALTGKAWWYLNEFDHVFLYAAYGNEAFLVEVIDELKGVGVLTLGVGGAYFPVRGFGLSPSFEWQARDAGRSYLQVGLEIKLRQ